MPSENKRPRIDRIILNHKRTAGVITTQDSNDTPAHSTEIKIGILINGLGLRTNPYSCRHPLNSITPEYSFHFPTAQYRTELMRPVLSSVLNSE